ncbi:MAG: hypothetical protein CMJ31_01460 [Phycisphaerae bacterium]|nr:hypothetical protein [Phycisphaerae bacterium]
MGVDIITAIAAILPAFALLPSIRRHARNGALRLRRPPAWLVITLPAIALLLTASASPPGALWSSEYGAYDVLSYHLALPLQWADAGRVAPLDTNVYSYLPSYLESLYTLVLTLDLGVMPGGRADAFTACHMLSAALTLTAAWTLAHAARRLAVLADRRERRHAAATIAAAVTLATPWVIVTGSIAYNEPAVLALGAAALLAAIAPRLTPVRRATLCAIIVGAATGVKPTALFLVGPAIGVLLIAMLTKGPNAKRLPVALAIGVVVGLTMLAPWMARNAIANGNPVFPFATDLFGAGAWTEDQVAAWTTAHANDFTIPERLGAMLWTAPIASPDAPAVERFRGMANPQWLAFFPVAFACLIGAIALGARHLRAVTTLLASGLVAGVIAWLLLTHIQSRFLLPLVVIASPAIGLAIAALPRRAITLTAAAIGAAQLIAAITIWSNELGGKPNAYLITGVDGCQSAPPTIDEQDMTPAQYANAHADDGPLLLLGEARRLYYEGEVISSTAWDHHLLEQAMIDAPNDTEVWLAALRDAGVTRVLINLAELDRLRSSGYTPPELSPEQGGHLLDRLRFRRAWRQLGVAYATVPRER